MNSISSWLCTGSSKNLFVKIVHPGGHVELHDRPIIAAEVLNRNPKCCVTHPTVFQQPHEIISPDTTLLLGQKYYIVPLGTIRKLQLRYPRRTHQASDSQQNMGNKNDDDDDGERWSICWLFRINNNRNGSKEKKDASSRIKTRASNSEGSCEETTRMAATDSCSGNVNASLSSAPGRLSLVSMDNWQPGLESITEEY